MNLYRVVHNDFLYDLSGEGAKKFGGRWNSAGVAVIYTSATPELALLESLCHNTFSALTKYFGMITLHINDRASQKAVTIEELSANWKRFPSPKSLAGIGDRWVRKNESLLLKVPSAFLPTSFNFLINPLHPQFRLVKIASAEKIPLDIRLVENFRN